MSEQTKEMPSPEEMWQELLRLREESAAHGTRIGELERRLGIAPAEQTAGTTAEDTLAAEVDEPTQETDVTRTEEPVDATLVQDEADIDGAGDGTIDGTTVITVPDAGLVDAVETAEDIDQNLRPAARVGGTLESRLGRYWLGRAGIVVVVAALALLLAQTYENFGPGVKIAGGYAFALVLLFAGEFFSRKENFKWYGQGLLGGAYALTYFVTYAVQNIASVKLIDEPTLAASGLLAIAGISMVHAIYKKSEPIALLSTLLAFGTISLSPVTEFSVAATIVLLIGLSATIIRQSWSYVYLVSAVGTGVTYVLFTVPHIIASNPEAASWIGMSFLAAFWLAYTFVGIRLFQKNPGGTLADTIASAVAKDGDEMSKLSFFQSPSFLLAVAVINAIMLIGGGMYFLEGPLADWRFLFLVGSAVMYFGAATVALKVEWKDFAVFSGLIALGCLTASVPLKLDPQATLAVWYLEIPLLVFAGQRLNWRSFRWMAYAITFLCSLQFFAAEMLNGEVLNESIPIAWNLLIGAVAFLSYSFSAASFQILTARDGIATKEGNVAKVIYAALAVAVVWSLTMLKAPVEWRAAIFALEALIFAAVAIGTPIKVSELGTKIFLLTAFVLCVADPATLPLAIAAVVAAGYGMAFTYKAGLLEPVVPNQGLPMRIGGAEHSHFAWIATSVALVLTTGARVDPVMAPVYIGVEAAALMSIGYLMRDKVLRLVGFAASIALLLSLWVSVGEWTWLSALLPVALLYGMSTAQRILKDDSFSQNHSSLSTPVLDIPENGKLFSNAATLVLTYALFQLLSWQMLAVAWAIEGLVLLVAGFLLKEKDLRVSSLALFALLIGKLVLFDFSDSGTMQLIVAIASGVILLIASYVYNFFAKQLEETEGGNGNTNADGSPDQTDDQQ